MDNISGKTSLVIGADIGGTHITSALIDLRKECTVAGSRVRYTVDPNAGAEDILDVWVLAIKGAMKKAELLSENVGIAMPGPFDYAAGICLIKDMHKYESLYALNIRSILSERLGISPQNIEFRNDAEAFLHGEVFCGAAKGYSRAFGITLGTGLGSAFSVNGETTDANLGVSPFYDGIAEDYISTRWCVKRFRELTGSTIKDVKMLAQRAVRDEYARKVFAEFAENLGRFIVNVLQENKAEIVVIGGNITLAHSLFWTKMENYVKKEGVEVLITRTKLGENASLIGAVCGFDNKITTVQFNKNALNP
ncbi:MAG: ROK family protein [Sphingobacteriaceae bacterium]|nr:ROK family protein [Sphingobacteriaceae bacterium]